MFWLRIELSTPFYSSLVTLYFFAGTDYMSLLFSLSCIDINRKIYMLILSLVIFSLCIVWVMSILSSWGLSVLTTSFTSFVSNTWWPLKTPVCQSFVVTIMGSALYYKHRLKPYKHESALIKDTPVQTLSNTCYTCTLRKKCMLSQNIFHTTLNFP